MKTFILFCCAVFCLVLGAERAQANTFTWTGGTSSQWITGSNWAGMSAPASGASADIIINGGTPFPPIISNAAFTCKSITFAGTNTLTLSKALTVSNAITVNASATIIVGAASSFGSIVVNSPLTLTITKALTVNGDLTVNADVNMAVTAASTVGSITFNTSGSTLTLSGNKLLNITGGNNIITVNADAIIDITSTASPALQAVKTGTTTGNLTLANGTLEIEGTGAAVFGASGATDSSISGTGTLTLDAGTNTTFYNLDIAAGGTVNSSGTLNENTTLSNLGTINFDSGSTFNFTSSGSAISNSNSIIANNTTFNFQASETITNTASSSFTGSSDTFNFTSTGSSMANGAGDTFNVPSATFNFNGNGNSVTNSGAFTLDNGTVNLGTAGFATNTITNNVGGTFNYTAIAGPSVMTFGSKGSLNNSGAFNATGCTFTLSGAQAEINNLAGTFTAQLCTFTITGSNTPYANITNASGATFTDNGGCIYNIGVVGVGNPNYISNSGTFTTAGTSLATGSTFNINGNKSNVSNLSTGIFSPVFATFNLTGLKDSINNASTTAPFFNAQSCSFNLSGGSSGNACVITNSGVYTDNAGKYIISGPANDIQNSGTNMHFSGSTISFTDPTSGAANILNNTGTLTADGGSVINVGSDKSVITNSGTFNAGTSGSACTINITSTRNSITNTGGTFNLGSTSIINSTGTGVSTITNTSPGVFTLQSDANGCAAIGRWDATTTTFVGTFNVQRYISGLRGYRLISSPVKATGSGTGLTYLQYDAATNPSGLWLTGTTGFNAPGNPTLYLYDEAFTPQYSTFLNSNYVGISSLTGNAASPKVTLNANGGGLSTVTPVSLPAGTGVFCFFRGNPLTETPGQLTTPSYPAAAATPTATGTFNLGQVAFTQWYTGSTTFGGTNQYFTLVGNPYPSAIDLNTIQSASTTTGIFATAFYDGGSPSASTGISQFIYELIPTGSAAGNYGVWTVGDDGSHAINGAIQYIGSGQGFFIQAFGANSSQLIFNESAKAASTNATSFGIMAKRVNSLAAINTGTVNPVLHLKLASDTTASDETLILFKPSASAKFVYNEDAPHQAGQGAVHLASRSTDSVAMAINTLPLQRSQTIPLNVNAGNDGLYTITMKQLVALPALYDVWLMDAYKKDSLDIKNNPTYSFDILHADANSFGANRFTLMIRQNPALMVHLLNFNATKATDGAQVAWTTENEQNYTGFAVERSTDGGVTFNPLGSFVSNALGAYSFLDKNPALPVDQYRLKMTDLNGTVSYSAVVTLMYQNTGTIAVNQVSVYPNPAATTINLSIAQNTITDKVLVSSPANPSYNIMITNSTGAVIKTVTAAQSQWQDDISTLLPGTYVIQVINAHDKTVVGNTKFVKL